MRPWCFLQKLCCARADPRRFVQTFSAPSAAVSSFLRAVPAGAARAATPERHPCHPWIGGLSGAAGGVLPLASRRAPAPVASEMPSRSTAPRLKAPWPPSPPSSPRPARLMPSHRSSGIMRRRSWEAKPEKLRDLGKKIFCASQRQLSAFEDFRCGAPRHPTAIRARVIKLRRDRALDPGTVRPPGG